MDTYINVKIYSNNKNLVIKAFKEINNIYQEYHQLSDRYQSYDNLINLYYINHNLDINKEIIINEKLYDMIKYSIDFYHKSNGLLNIALGNVIDVWKQYREEGIGIPTEKELMESGSIDIDNIILSDKAIMKKNNIKIDLGAIAKGYATEKVGQYLESIGLNQYIINAGGNVKVGSHYQDDNYTIGVEDPNDTTEIYQVIKGNNMVVVTSGGYERFYEYKGQKYHHIIDPNTLFPPQYMQAVTVICDNSAYGDALSTILFLMPIETGINYINNLDNVEAVWYGLDNQIYYSEGFDKYA